MEKLPPESEEVVKAVIAAQKNYDAAKLAYEEATCKLEAAENALDDLIMRQCPDLETVTKTVKKSREVLRRMT